MAILTSTFPDGHEVHDSFHRISRRMMLLCLLGILPASSARIGRGGTGSTMTDFVPQQHGFRFRNSFFNVVLDIPGVHLVTRGRCGGMAYTALDYYFAHLPIPQYAAVPECEPDSKSYGPGAYRLVQYIFSRQLDSMTGIWPFGRASDFLWYTRASDNEVFEWTTGNELDKLAQWIQAGIPIPLGLIGVREVARIGENHQVVAHGYELDPSSRTIASVHIYDPNHPDQNVTLFVDKTRRYLQASSGRSWRGFFVRDDYWPHTPPVVIDARQ